MLKKCFHTPAALLMMFCGAASAIDFTPHGTQPGLNFELIGAGDCANCHSSSEPGHDAFMPHNTWSGSMMANAARDPLFWAALDVANNDFPGSGEFCLRCHTPFGFMKGRVKDTGADGCELESNPDSAAEFALNDYQSVTCNFCHRIDESGPLGEPLITQNGSIWVDDEECPNGEFGRPCRKGPYTYPDNSGVSAPPHGWEQSNFIQSSAFCGTCHNVSSPDTDEGILKTLVLNDGTDTGLAFPIERTYTEWQQSDFADVIFSNALGDLGETLPAIAEKTDCQTCHMPQSDDANTRACIFENQGSRTGDLRTHAFVGGNTWIPEVLKGEYPGLSRSQAFDNTIAWAEQMLTDAAAVEVTTSEIVDEQLQATIRVTNLSGHKLPTGYSEGRRMWLQVQAFDNDNNQIFDSGAYDANTGVLTEDAQIKIYEVLQGQWDGDSCEIEDGLGAKQFHFVLNNCVVKDNRIPPKGFVGGSDVETQPVAATFDDLGGGKLAHYDDTVYTIAVPDGTSLPISVEATLVFQVASKEYIDFLVGEAVEHSFQSENMMCNRVSTVGPGNQTRAAFLEDLWENYGRSAPAFMAMDIGFAGAP